MGLQLIIKEVCLNDVSKAALPAEADKLDRTISECREKLLMLAASTPSESEDCEGNIVDAVENVHRQASGLLEEFEEAVINRHLVGVAMGDLDSV